MAARRPLTINPSTGRHERLQQGDSIDGVLDHPGFISGFYYASPSIISTATGAIAAGQIWYYPFPVPSPANFDRIAMQITTASAAGGKGRLAIIDTLAGDRPNNPIFDSGEFLIDSIGLKEQSFNQTLEAGRYMLAAAISAGCSAISVININPALHTFGFTAPPVGTFQSLRAVFTFGAFPSPVPMPGLTGANPGPLISIRKS